MSKAALFIRLEIAYGAESEVDVRWSVESQNCQNFELLGVFGGLFGHDNRKWIIRFAGRTAASVMVSASSGGRGSPFQFCKEGEITTRYGCNASHESTYVVARVWESE